MLTKIGVTATQQGLNQKQWKIANNLLRGIDVLHHGDCVGGDYDLHVVTRQVSPGAKIVIHPPLDDKKRAWCVGDELLTPDGYRERNDAIVWMSNRLIAFPSSMVEILRSGTWMTVRLARKARARGHSIQTLIVFPDGRVVPDNTVK